MSAQSCSGDDNFYTEVKAESAESPLSIQISKYNPNRKRKRKDGYVGCIISHETGKKPCIVGWK